MAIDVLVLGNKKTGKTSFINVVRDFNITDIKLCDSPDNHSFELDTPLYDAYVICYDVTNQRSFEYVANWVADIRSHHRSHATILLVGTHAEIDRSPRVSFETANSFAKNNNLLFAETSIELPSTISNACKILWQDLQLCNPAIHTILTKLNRYIVRIETTGDTFDKDFYLFAKQRGSKRSHDYTVAQRLKRNLMQNPPITSSFFDVSDIHSRELNTIIKEARKAFLASSLSSSYPRF